MRTHLLLLFILLFFIDNRECTVFSSSIQSCRQHCSERNLAFPLEKDELKWSFSFFQTCDSGCRIKACELGCADLDESLSNCHSRCISLDKGIDSCEQGCHAVEQKFISQIQVIVLDSLALEGEVPNGITLHFSFPQYLSSILQEISSTDISCYAQSKGTSNNPGWKWTSLGQKAFRNTSQAYSATVPLESSSQISVRLAVVWRDKVIVSRPLLWTLPPSSVLPMIKVDSQLQIASDKYTVCWKTNRHEGLFRISLTTLDGNPLQIIETPYNCHLLRDLPHENCCRATISDITVNKETPEAEITVKIDMIDVQVDSSQPSQLVLTNGAHIVQLENVNDYIVTKDPIIVPFELATDDKITAMVGISSDTLVIGTERGGIWSVPIVNTNETEMTRDDEIVREVRVLREADGSGITQIVHDPLQRMVYALLSKKGLLRCSLEPAPCTFLDTDAPIQYITVDSWNGFVYFIGSDGNLVQAELFSFNATESYNFEKKKVLPDLSPAVAMEIDYNQQELFVVLQNGSVIGRDIVTGNCSLRRDGSYPGVKKVHLTNGRMFWTKLKCGDTALDEVCFYSEEKDEETIHFSRYLYSGILVDFSFLLNPLYPPSLLSPIHSGLITSDYEARITWKPPQSMPYQAMGNGWRNTQYECRLQASNSDTSMHQFTNFTDLLFPIVAATEYTASVRACTLHICSPFANSINTAFSPLNGTPIYMMKRNGDMILNMDILGKAVPMEPILETIQVDKDAIVTFDNSTQTIYTIQPQSQISVIRSSPFFSSSTFLNYFMFSYSTILPSRSIIVFASAYQIISYRLTGTFDQMIYSCSTVDVSTCSEVVGLAGDDKTGEIFYITQASNGTVQLFSIRSTDRTTQLMASSADFPPIQQLVVTNEKLVFITRRGNMGFVDKQLGTLNMNHALNGVDVIIPIREFTGNNRFEFNSEVTMGENTKNELTWSTVSQRKENGSILYKISLFKDHLGSEDSFQSVSLNLSYSLPSSLLESWNSGQHFDVTIEAINAWTIGNVSKTGLIAPIKPPTQPQYLRIYATQQKTVDGARAIISLFWNEPKEWNGVTLKYILNCTQENNVIVVDLPSTATHHSFAVKNGKVTCMVAAANEPSNIGEFSPEISIDSSELRPLVRLFAIDSTNDLIAIPNITDGNTPKKRKRRQIGQGGKEYQAIAFIENDLYAVVKEPDTIQPSLVQLDTNNISTILHKYRLFVYVSIGGEVSRIEAMTSDWVGFRLLIVMDKGVYQITLDPFFSSSILTPKKLIDLSLGASEAKQLTFDPFTNTAYLLTRNGSLFSLNFSKGLEENLALTVSCLTSQTVTWMTTEFAWNRAVSPKIYALTWNGLIEVELGGRCGELKSIDWNKFGEKGLKAMSAFSIADKLFVFVTSSEMLIYRPDGSITPIPINNAPVRQILAVSQSSQPYPERSCFSLPSSSQIQFSVVNEGRTGAVVTVSKPPFVPSCALISLPQTLYDIYFNRTDKSRVKHIESYTDIFHVENGTLDKETDYDVRVSWHNRYSTETGISEGKSFRTGFGYPSSPRNPKAFAITPDTVFLMWMMPETLNAPIEQIKYRISQQVSTLSSPSSIAVQPWSIGGFSASTTDAATCLENPCRVKIANLRPTTDYKFWVTAIHESHLRSQFPEDSEAVSVEATAKTKDIAGTLRPDNVTGSSLLLRWNSLQPELPPTTVSIQYKESGGFGEWKTPKNASFEPKDIKSSIGILITNLLSATSYDYRFVAVYKGTYDMEGKTFEFSEDYYQGIQQGRTKAGTPTEPQSVTVRQDNEGWIVEWQPPTTDGGSPITSYAVEMRVNRTAEWEIAERGLDGRIMWWRPPKTDTTNKRQFRVRAANTEGFGPYREVPMDPADLEEDESSSEWLPIVISVAIIVIVALVGALLIIARQRRNDSNNLGKLDEKMITLEEMSKFPSHKSHPLPMQIQNELKNLPHMRKEDIREIQLIGKGSFGEVLEGLATKLPLRSDQNIRVALKKLRPEHSEADRVKFLKEAILMNNFDHPNIVKLLGVSFDDSTHYLVMELMEEGDLLHYLTQSRPTDSHPLSIKDLLGMIIDIARGAAYLEMNHHIHRDLAARNCLITKTPMTVTKIADFGLARDMFSSEYYQVRGEDFLPLRWLAPESALAGVFSSKSDVWSFGILLWEIMTLGQTPYGQKENKQVLQLIKSGIHPEKPGHCPEEIHRMMELCWKHEANERPTFHMLQAEFEMLRENEEYQDDSPFLPLSFGHINNAFDTSIDSNSSDKERESRSVFPLSKGREGQKLDKSLGSLSSRRHLRPTVVRAVRMEKGKSTPMPDSDELDSRRYSHRSHSLVSPEEGAHSSSFGPSTSNTLRSGTRLTNGHSITAHDNDGFVPDHSMVLSQSWSGPNHAISIDPSGSNQLTVPSRNHFPNVRNRPINRGGVGESTHETTDNMGRKSRVSQV